MSSRIDIENLEVKYENKWVKGSLKDINIKKFFFYLPSENKTVVFKGNSILVNIPKNNE